MCASIYNRNNLLGIAENNNNNNNKKVNFLKEQRIFFGFYFNN